MQPDHAERREYVRAIGSLYFGLEGAYREAAYASTTVTRPKGTKRALAFEKLVKLMSLPSELKMFVAQAVFGGPGNTIRHAHVEGDERRQVLLGIVALAAWLELFAGAAALELLTGNLQAMLPRAVEQVPAMPALTAGS